VDAKIFTNFDTPSRSERLHHPTPSAGVITVRLDHGTMNEQIETVDIDPTGLCPAVKLSGLSNAMQILSEHHELTYAHSRNRLTPVKAP
jgi:hypothetical protein